MVYKMALNKLLIYFLVIFGSLFFIACSGSSVAYPNWYLDSSTDNKYLYGVGEAENLTSAKLAALNDMASKISLNIQSNLNIRKEQIDSKVSSSFNNDIGINVNDIELDSVEYPLIEEVEGLFFVQARLLKSKVINKLNSDISSYSIDMINILNDIKNSKCSTMNPKHRFHLLNLSNNADHKSKQIVSLNGIVKQKQLLQSVKTMLESPPSAYYVSFASGGSSSSYTLVDNALINEYSKFFSIQPKSFDIYYIENTYNINNNRILLNASIMDCNNNAIFSISLESSNDEKESNWHSNAIKRLQAQIYKKMLSWQEE